MSSRNLMQLCRRVRPLGAGRRWASHYIRSVDGVPDPGEFSRAVVDGGKVYVSGTGAGNDTATGAVRSGTAYDEAGWALQNVATILEAASSTPAQALSVTMLLTDKEDYAECNRAYLDFFRSHGVPVAELPARSTALWGVPTTAKVAFSVIANVAKDGAAAG